ncbi:hypothetical protein [Niabella drilacis]|uniref:Beta-lactamase-inhibitor-like, PepSY-like n=1 Tax=Niabella drilacis (strain DSM 25811 / CCM 8410 / CCUG 62505 / LMG 26954 / E90) TaxID=1285928 RepID=A0A1G6XXL0_NIADE|nr:hypothetical protein [Niabella drilacis]SDD82413.1 hypothetical protein SAMN04487894_11443 [Niabella drilacis]
MKRPILILLLLSAGYMACAATPGPDIENKKAGETFRMLFKKVDHLSWYATEEYTVADFNLREMKVKAFFDRSGALTQTLRYYKGDLLPLQIAYKLKKRYTGFEIFGVTELSTPERISYTIILTGEKDGFRLVTDENGRVQSSKKFRRGDLDS